jgi:hypothetical protein
VLVLLLVLDLFFVFDHEHEQEHEHEIKARLVRREIFAMRACMSAAVIDYALCGCCRSTKHEDRVGR